MSASSGVRFELSLIAKHRNKKVLENVCQIMGIPLENIRERKGVFEARLWFKGKQQLINGDPVK